MSEILQVLEQWRWQAQIRDTSFAAMFLSLDLIQEQTNPKSWLN